jgi:hypothetical protein
MWAIGIDGLRRLHGFLCEDYDAVLNHIEYYVESKEGALFTSCDKDGPDEFEEQRATREKIDHTKPLGYFERRGEPCPAE